MFRSITKAIISALGLIGLIGSLWVVSFPSQAATVLVYHRFGEEDYPTTSISVDLFERQLAYLAQEGFEVVPLHQLVDDLLAGKAPGPKQVAITIDDAYLSVWEEARPLLEAYGFAYTLFVSSDALGGADFMSAAQVAALAATPLAEIGHHSAAHSHMSDDDAQTLQDDLARADLWFTQHLGARPDIFAYPYGEISSALKSAIEEAGFIAAFGQHSGGLGLGLDPFALPRFALNEHYGEMERFAQILGAGALVLENLQPQDWRLAPNGQGIVLSFTSEVSPLACFLSGKTLHLVKNDGMWHADLTRHLSYGRNRLNCTANQNGQLLWGGASFYLPQP